MNRSVSSRRSVSPRLLLFATTTGYQIRAFGEAAARAGVTLVFASDRCDQLEDPWYDQAIPIRFHDEAGAVDAVLRAVEDAPPDGVLAVGDRPVIVAARVAAALGLPFHSPDAAAISRNKLETRRALRDAGLLTPSFHPVSIDADVSDLAATLQYPVVIKPLALSASRGVMRADDPAALQGAARRLRNVLREPDVRTERDAAHDQAVIESFVPGAEFALEGLLTDGTLTTFAIFDKPDPLDGPFFEETIYVTPSRATPAVQESVRSHVARAAQAIGLQHGPVHAECRVNATGAYVLEVAARPIGGLCSKAIRLTTPDGGLATLEDVLLRHAIGLTVAGYRPDTAASGVMMIPIPRRGILKGVDGVDEARAVAGVTDVRITAKPDARLVPLPEGHSYLGFIFAAGEGPAFVEAALRDAHARLRFRIDADVPVVADR